MYVCMTEIGRKDQFFGIYEDPRKFAFCFDHYIMSIKTFDKTFLRWTWTKKIIYVIGYACRKTVPPRVFARVCFRRSFERQVTKSILSRSPNQSVTHVRTCIVYRFVNYCRRHCFRISYVFIRKHVWSTYVYGWQHTSVVLPPRDICVAPENHRLFCCNHIEWSTTTHTRVSRIYYDITARARLDFTASWKYLATSTYFP